MYNDAIINIAYEIRIEITKYFAHLISLSCRFTQRKHLFTLNDMKQKSENVIILSNVQYVTHFLSLSYWKNHYSIYCRSATVDTRLRQKLN